MKTVKSLRWPSGKRRAIPDGEAGQGGHGFKMIQLSVMGFLCIVMVFIVLRTADYLYKQTKIDDRLHPFGNLKELPLVRLDGLPHGIINPRADLELRSLWSSSNSTLKADGFRNRNLLAMAVGIVQKDNVGAIVKKFLSENFTVILFHYDGNVNGWSDLSWSNSTIHIVAQSQTKWWFAKRFLHPDVVNIYDYIFVWDEDLGVKNFHPGRYIFGFALYHLFGILACTHFPYDELLLVSASSKSLLSTKKRYLTIVKSKGLEISQPALDPLSTGIHHKITIRKRTEIVHRRMYGRKGNFKCSNSSRGPPCTGWVEVMAPVFSRAAWHCAWNLIQNDLVHGWGLDIKIGYCAQGDRTERVGIVDSEYIVHQGIETLGGSSAKKASDSAKLRQTSSRRPFDNRYTIRRQATEELEIFKERWDKAVKEDKNWVDPYWNWLDTFSKLKRQHWMRSKHV